VNKQGELALKRLSDVHDVHVPLCPALLSEFSGMKYTYSHAITRQYMLASAAFLRLKSGIPTWIFVFFLAENFFLELIRLFIIRLLFWLQPPKLI
jgi:hypothetical protein